MMAVAAAAVIAVTLAPGVYLIQTNEQHPGRGNSTHHQTHTVTKHAIGAMSETDDSGLVTNHGRYTVNLTGRTNLPKK